MSVSPLFALCAIVALVFAGESLLRGGNWLEALIGGAFVAALVYGLIYIAKEKIGR